MRSSSNPAVRTATRTQETWESARPDTCSVRWWRRRSDRVDLTLYAVIPPRPSPCSPWRASRSEVAWFLIAVLVLAEYRARRSTTLWAGRRARLRSRRRRVRDGSPVRSRRGSGGGDAGRRRDPVPCPTLAMRPTVTSPSASSPIRPLNCGGSIRGRRRGVVARAAPRGARLIVRDEGGIFLGRRRRTPCSRISTRSHRPRSRAASLKLAHALEALPLPTLPNHPRPIPDHRLEAVTPRARPAVGRPRKCGSASWRRWSGSPR